jgi:hypothetical protein
LYAL